jgi:GntR family transcriptional regulator, transcriptional repressor for pyruvate dehydrogenase complex
MSGQHPGVPSLVQQAMHAISGYIRDKGLRVGDTLPGEAWFAASLAVSRPVMREAFGALAALGVIDVGNGRKARVGAIDGSAIATSLGHAVMTAQITVPQVWDVRRTIEARTAALAAASRTGAEATRIVELADAMGRAIDHLAGMTVHDIAFHQAIARAGHNPLFTQIVSSFAPLMEVAVPAAWRTRTTTAERRAIVERHRDVALAIWRQDPAAAAAAMDAHFDASVGALLETRVTSDAA